MKNQKRNQQTPQKLGKNIDISNNSFARLQKHATPLTDVANDALRKALYKAEGQPDNVPPHIARAVLKDLSLQYEDWSNTRENQTNHAGDFLEQWFSNKQPKGVATESQESEEHAEQTETPAETQAPTETDRFPRDEEKTPAATPQPEPLEAGITDSTKQPAPREDSDQSTGETTFRNQYNLQGSIESTEYQLPTLQAIQSMGGRANVATINTYLEGKMRHRFNPRDLETNAAQQAIWKSRAEHARNRLSKHEMIEKTNRRYVWAITPKGTERIASETAT